MNTNLRVAIWYYVPSYLPLLYRKQIPCSGAGIGGLTLALALSRFPNIDVSIYESAQALAEIGAGIGVFPSEFNLFILGVQVTQIIQEYGELSRSLGSMKIY